MENKLKEEYFSFFWIRVGIGILIGLFVFVASKPFPILENQILRPILNIVVGYILSSEILRRKINGNKSDLYMVFNQTNKERLETFDFMKVYWSFYWRESLIGFVLLGMMSLIGYFIIKGVSYSALMLSLFIFVIMIFIASYYIGRYVFKHVISQVFWQIGRIEVDLED